MERIINDQDSLRRAEEIYSRKNGINLDTNKRKYFSIYKFLFQLLVLINLAVCLILYQNKDFVFSTDFLNKVNEFYNINITEKLENFLKDDDVKDNPQPENVPESKEAETNSDEKIQENQSNEMSKIEIIKSSYSFIKPIEGTITSFFGIRESSNENISGNHTGIDISAIKGTKIKSSTEGNVIQVSEKGNYGKHIKIKNEDIITLYAHCNSIFVNEGDRVKQGQDIAEVGSTGKSTDPHLHFEIRYGEEYINPTDILNF